MSFVSFRRRGAMERNTLDTNRLSFVVTDFSISAILALMSAIKVLCYFFLEVQEKEHTIDCCGSGNDNRVNRFLLNHINICILHFNLYRYRSLRHWDQD